MRATHRSTIEVTMDDYLTPRGDCIVGIDASKAPAMFSDDFRRLAARSSSIIIAVFCAPGGCDVVTGRGSPRLSLSDERRMVLRRSSYVDEGTVMIMADKAAADLGRDLAASLRSSASRLHVVLVVVDPSCRSTA